MVAVTERVIKELEKDLANQQNLNRRLQILDTLCSLYTFTNIDKAQEALRKLHANLQQLKLPDFQLNYLWYKALVENQLYHYQQAADCFREALKLVEERGNIHQQV